MLCLQIQIHATCQFLECDDTSQLFIIAIHDSVLDNVLQCLTHIMRFCNSGSIAICTQRIPLPYNMPNQQHYHCGSMINVNWVWVCARSRCMRWVCMYEIARGSGSTKTTQGRSFVWLPSDEVPLAHFFFCLLSSLNRLRTKDNIHLVDLFISSSVRLHTVNMCKVRGKAPIRRTGKCGRTSNSKHTVLFRFYFCSFVCKHIKYIVRERNVLL